MLLEDCQHNILESILLRFSILLIIGMAAYWMALSGYFKPILLTLGVISIFLVTGLVKRMKIMDDETVPYLHLPKSLSYFSWLFREIAKANVDVVKAVLAPNIDVTPAMMTVKSRQETDLGKTMFANSITLTPGTVSVSVDEDNIIVHALLSDSVTVDDFDEMAARSAWAVDDKISAPESH